MKKSIIFVFVLMSCSTVAKQESKISGIRPESGKNETEETVSALKSVTKALSGKDLPDQKLKDLSSQIRNDEETKGAIEAITGTMGATNQKIKYCPVCGKRYSPRLEMCPLHKVLLKEVEE